MIKLIALMLSTIGFSSTTLASEFRPIQSIIEKLECSSNKNTITLSGVNKLYSFYEKISGSVKLIECQKIQISGLVFYSLLFSNESQQGKTPHKKLTLEIALQNKSTGALKAVRSEVIDNVSLIGDLVNTDFENSVKTEWGQSLKDEKVILKIEISNPNEKPFSYLLKLNQKQDWLENIL